MKIIAVVIFIVAVGISESKSQSFAWGVGAEDAIPTGAWSNDYGNGIGGSGSFEFGIARIVNGYVRVGYLKFSQKQVQQLGYYDLQSGTYFDFGNLTYHASFWSFLAGAKVGFGGPYLAIEMGYYAISAHYDFGGDTYDESGLGGFGIAPAVGYEFGVSEFMAIDLSAKYAIVKSSNHLGIRAGVKFGI